MPSSCLLLTFSRLNGLFGVVSDATGAEWAEFQSECATTWGSFGYLCSALCQWYEAVNKHPIEEGVGDTVPFWVELANNKSSILTIRAT